MADRRDLLDLASPLLHLAGAYCAAERGECVALLAADLSCLSVPSELIAELRFQFVVGLRPDTNSEFRALCHMDAGLNAAFRLRAFVQSAVRLQAIGIVSGRRGARQCNCRRP